MWDAHIKEELGDVLTDEDKEWRNRPVPDYANPKDVPQSLEIKNDAPSAVQLPTSNTGAPEGEPDEFDGLSNHDGNDDDEL